MADGKTYLEKLGKAYEKCNLKNKWEHLLDIAQGITEADKQTLLKEYPETPKSLVDILEQIDGTYHRQYADEKALYYFFGSDVDDGEYPYYLFSFQDIMENKDAAENFADLFYYFLEEPDEEYGPFVDERIQTDVSKLKWLNFSDCMNNGGSSSLYIDFTPSEKGTKGQIIRYLHDPDELQVIADSFDEFLDMLIENDFAFINEDDFDY